MSAGNLAQKPFVVVVVGATAVGKSDLALALALRFSGEIISADSRQTFRFLDVGTAKPTIDERLTIAHHLVDLVNPDDEYTLANFQNDAYRAITAVTRRGRLPIVVGGTGLYIKALVDGLRIPPIPPQPDLRAILEERARRHGTEALHQELFKLDPAAAGRIDSRNVRRVVRALEVCLISGRPISELQRAGEPDLTFCVIGLTCSRETLYKRIDERVERQFASGLLEETKRVLDMGYAASAPVSTGLGHRQAGMYLRGEVGLREAIQLDKNDTHRFARQQQNWFRRNDPRIKWLDRDELQWNAILHRAERFVEEGNSANFEAHGPVTSISVCRG